MIAEILRDRALKPKEKTERIAGAVLNGTLALPQIAAFCHGAKDSDRATCMEAPEYASQANPHISTQDWLAFAGGGLGAEAPRIKWESAKVIGNIAHL